MDAEKKRLNLFAGLAEMDRLHKTLDFAAENEMFFDSSFTVDVIDMPYLLFYRSDKDVCELFIDIRYTRYKHEENPRFRKAELRVPRGGGMQGQAADDVQQLAAPLMIFCMKLAKYISDNEIDRKYTDVDPEKAGILLQTDNEGLGYREVSGNERPDLLCKTLTGELKMTRPYESDLQTRLILDALPLELKEKRAEAGDMQMMKHLYHYYMGNDDSPNAELKKASKKIHNAYDSLLKDDKNPPPEVEEDTFNPEKAFYWCKKMAENGDADAMMDLVDFYLLGLGTEQDYRQAAVWAEKSNETGKGMSEVTVAFFKRMADLKDDAEAGKADAQWQLAKALWMLVQMSSKTDNGKIKEDAFRWAQKSAAQSDPDGIYTMATFFKDGFGVQKDPVRAFRLFERAAQKDHAPSQAMLGQWYGQGIGTTKNPQAAFEWSLKAAEAGDVNGMSNLAGCYLTGIGTATDVIKAKEWLKKAADLGDENAKKVYDQLNSAKQTTFENTKSDAEKGDPEAQLLLGTLYALGVETDQSFIQAIKWMEKAAEKGKEDAQRFIAIFAGADELEEKAEKGDPQAQADLADRLIGVTNLYDKAEKTVLFEKSFHFAQASAETGNAHGLFALAKCYENGYGVEVDDDRAFELYKRSAEAGDSYGELGLSIFYLVGKGTPINADLAIEWFDKAKEHGNPDMDQASIMIRQLMMHVGADKLGRGEKTGGPDPAQGLKFIRKAAELGEPEAQRILGLMFLQGHRGAELEPDFECGIEWLKKAAENGSEKAAKELEQNSRPEAYNAAANREFLRKDRAPDKEKVFRLMKQAAEGGLAASQRSLGMLYMNGVGVKPDYDLGIEWYRKAAAQGNEGAKKDLEEYEGNKRPDKKYMAALVMLAYNKKSGEQDTSRALQLLQESAEKGCAEANNILGLFRADPEEFSQKFGAVGDRNYEEAERFFKKALELKPDLKQADNNLKKLSEIREGNLGETRSSLKWETALPRRKTTAHGENKQASASGDSADQTPSQSEDEDTGEDHIRDDKQDISVPEPEESIDENQKEQEVCVDTENKPASCPDNTTENEDENLLWEAAEETRISSFGKIGETVCFGRYKQSTDNKPEEIEWIVIDTNGKESLLISKYALDCKPYHTLCEKTSWDTCFLRQWLNEYFLHNAFSEAERKVLCDTVTENVTDQVFLLSKREAQAIVSRTRICRATSHAAEKGAYVNGIGNCWWWLRTSDKSGDKALAVSAEGGFRSGDVDNQDFAVRPAIWINLEALADLRNEEVPREDNVSGKIIREDDSPDEQYHLETEDQTTEPEDNTPRSSNKLPLIAGIIVILMVLALLVSSCTGANIFK